jgi:Family of unknown function (DUF5681)
MKSGQNTEKKQRGNVANLRPPWKKGQSGNPGGRPKGSISKYYKLILEETDPKTHKVRAEKLARRHIDEAEANPSFANIVLDRTEGKVVQPIDIGMPEDLAELIAEGRKRAAEKNK